jgi:recombination protein RecA
MPPKKKGAKAQAVPVKRARRAEEEGPSRSSRASELLEYVNTKMKGKAELCIASELSLPYITKRLPTGLLSLDLELIGGFPAGGISQIVGPRNAGKDWLCWQLIRQLQYLLGENTHVLMAQTELRADRTQGRKAGAIVALSDADISSMSKARVQSGLEAFTAAEKVELKKEIGHIHEVHGMAAEDLYDVILRAVEANIYHLIIINSFGNIMSGAEAESESMRDKTYGGAAGVNTQFLHKLTSYLLMKDEYGKTRDTCMIGINQIRDDIKNPNKEYKASGGRALEHAKLVDLFISSGKAIGSEVKMPGPSGTQQRFVMTGKEVNWRIEKGKAGIHEGGRGTFLFEFSRNNANFYLDTLIVGVKMGIIEQNGAYYNYMGERLGLGRDAAVASLETNAQACAASNNPNSIMNQIRQKAFELAGINIDYDWGSDG